MFKKKLLNFYCLLIGCFLIFIPVAKADDWVRVFMVGVEYNEGEARITGVTTKMEHDINEAIDKSLERRYLIKSFSLNNEVINEREFAIPEELKGSDEILGFKESAIKGKINVSAVIPYAEDVKALKLYDADNNLLDEKDVSFLHNYCPNNFCDKGENYGSCPADCPPAVLDNFCNLEMAEEDPDCPKQLEQEEKTGLAGGKSAKFLILGGLAAATLAVMAAAYYFLVRKKDREGE